MRSGHGFAGRASYTKLCALAVQRLTGLVGYAELRVLAHMHVVLLLDQDYKWPGRRFKITLMS